MREETLFLCTTWRKYRYKLQKCAKNIASGRRKSEKLIDKAYCKIYIITKQKALSLNELVKITTISNAVRDIAEKHMLCFKYKLISAETTCKYHF